MGLDEQPAGVAGEVVGGLGADRAAAFDEWRLVLAEVHDQRHVAALHAPAPVAVTGAVAVAARGCAAAAGGGAAGAGAGVSFVAASDMGVAARATVAVSASVAGAAVAVGAVAAAVRRSRCLCRWRGPLPLPAAPGCRPPLRVLLLRVVRLTSASAADCCQSSVSPWCFLSSARWAFAALRIAASNAAPCSSGRRPLMSNSRPPSIHFILNARRFRNARSSATVGGERVRAKRAIARGAMPTPTRASWSSVAGVANGIAAVT